MKFLRIGRLCINFTKNTENGFKIKPQMFPEGTRLCELFCDSFTKNWGAWWCYVRFFKHTINIEYRFGNKCYLGNKLEIKSHD
jgi:hypothetical protein